MRFNDHSRLVGSHAFLSPSKSAWINYSEDEQLDRMVHAHMAAARGTRLHELAQNLISLGQRLPENTCTLNMYVNDCIGFGLRPETTFFYSPNCYGTADAANFHERKKFLRIFDLKTGVIECKMGQLKIYASLFCLEYGFKPVDIETELRIYQNDAVKIETADPLEITSIMDRIVHYDRRIEEIKREEYR